MRKYPHHIGDFNNATRHLNRIERSLYRDLIELYYDTEAQLPSDIEWISRRIIATEHSTDVERMLNEFFVKTPNGWYHDRCEAELDDYRSKTTQKALAGKASAEKKAERRRQALNGSSTSVEQALNGSSTEITNLEPRTINHKPVTNKKNTTRKRVLCVDDLVSLGVDAQVAEDWLSIRKQKKLPLTKTALSAIEVEAKKAGCTLAHAILIAASNGWAGYKADWVNKIDSQSESKKTGFIETHTDRSWAH